MEIPQLTMRGRTQHWCLSPHELSSFVDLRYRSDAVIPAVPVASPRRRSIQNHGTRISAVAFHPGSDKRALGTSMGATRVQRQDVTEYLIGHPLHDPLPVCSICHPSCRSFPALTPGSGKLRCRRDVSLIALGSSIFSIWWQN